MMRLVDWRNCFYRLDLHDHKILHEQINSITDVELFASINNWKS
jgi:hypothetical protein